MPGSPDERREALLLTPFEKAYSASAHSSIFYKYITLCSVHKQLAKLPACTGFPNCEHVREARVAHFLEKSTGRSAAEKPEAGIRLTLRYAPRDEEGSTRKHSLGEASSRGMHRGNEPDDPSRSPCCFPDGDGDRHQAHVTPVQPPGGRAHRPPDTWKPSDPIREACSSRPGAWLQGAISSGRCRALA